MGCARSRQSAGMGKREETRRFWRTWSVGTKEQAATEGVRGQSQGGAGGASVLDLQAATRPRSEAPPAAASSELRLVPVRVAPQTTATFEHAGRVEVRFGAFRFACDGQRPALRGQCRGSHESDGMLTLPPSVRIYLASALVE